MDLGLLEDVVKQEKKTTVIQTCWSWQGDATKPSLTGSEENCKHQFPQHEGSNKWRVDDDSQEEWAAALLL